MEKSKKSLLKKIFLPAGLVLAIVTALSLPGPAATCKELGLVPWLVVIIFLINGMQAKLKQAPMHGRFVGVALTAAVISLLIGPFLGLGGSTLVGLAGALGIGMIVMASAPPTLSSGIVITETAHGNVLWALILTIGLNFLGILTVPFMVKITAGAAGAQPVSALPLLIKLLWMVLLPFTVGALIRHLLLKERKLPAVVSYIPSTCVILTVWMSCGASSDRLKELAPKSFVLIAITALAIHFILMGLQFVGSLPWKLKRDERIAVLFVGSQKTLPVAISVIAAIGAAGTALVPCIVFHFLQLLSDSIIASKLASGNEEVTGDQ